MTVDWAATGTWMQAWAGFAQAGAVAFAAWKAANTFKAWRKQKIEERRLATAENILTVTYKIQRAFSVIRNSVTSEVALEEAERRLLRSGFQLHDQATDKQKRILESQVIFDRVDQFSVEWDQLSTLAPLSKALFGKKAEEAIESIWREKIAVQVAAENYIVDDETDPVFTMEIRDTIWEDRGKSAGRNDPVKVRLEAAIKKLDDLLLPTIRSG